MGFFLSTPNTEINIPKRFSIKFTFIVLTSNGLHPVERKITIQNKMVVMVFHIRAVKQARFSLLSYGSKEPETHEAQPFVLQSHVMQCRRFSWQVTRVQSLVKALSRSAACSGTVSAKRDLQTRWITCWKVHVCFPQRSPLLKSLTRTSHANKID